MRIENIPPAALEITAYCDRLKEITNAGGRLKLIQIYTIARQPAESYVAPLTAAEVDAIAETVAKKTGLQVERYYGSSAA